jgi:DNA polymerase III delta prime subunit
MPRGVYDRTAIKAKRAAQRQAEFGLGQFPVVNVNRRPETDAEVDARIAERFDVLEEITKSVITGVSRSLIVSGPAGLGKSFTVEKVMREWDPEEQRHVFIKGYVKATGLYKLLYQFRHEGNVIVFDDADSVFLDEISLNLIKAIADTTERRRVSWLSEAVLVDADSSDVIPRSFDFNGSIVFITNTDFDAQIERGSKLAPHLQAMMSRSHYVDLTMKTRQDYIVRIRQVVKQGLLSDLNWVQAGEVMRFVESNAEKLRELSLRMVIKIARIRLANGDKWERIARITCIKE